MKALLYKEFKLAMHPICYVFIFVFPLITLIPSYPLGVGFVYIMSCYPILFLGANKGQQSNDLLYSTLLPIRKKDIVLARIITVAFMQFVYIALMAALYPVNRLIHDSIYNSSGETFIPGIDLNGFISLIAIGLIGFAVADLIFFPIYYKNGKSIVKSTLFTILGFVTYLGVFTIALPLIFEPYYKFFCGEIWVQLIILFVALAIYFAAHLGVYKISAKKLEKVDF